MVDIDTLKEVHFLKPLSHEILETICPIARLKNVSQDAVLVRQDQVADRIYMLISGKILLNARNRDGKEVTLDELTPGSSFGLSSLLGAATPAAFTAVCVQDCQVITLDVAELTQVFEADYATGYAVMKAVVYQLKSRMNRHTQRFLNALRTHPAVTTIC
jgi:CRP-like cAMP-binding protein